MFSSSYFSDNFWTNSKEYLELGITKHNNKDFEGAIKEYSKAIKVDNNYTDAYFNKGTCELALKDFKSAKRDFDKAIEIDPKYIRHITAELLFL
ncbi:MAG: tetratricopeptide repeat protein [Bacteroidetes bacterium]|nr:tetratricopeptide repeat protein [Bacteroidota bacterium]